MYQVVVMYGDNEPWWFFEDWHSDVREEESFADFESAKTFFEKKWVEFHLNFSHLNGKPNYLCAFWNDQDERWCEECDDFIQQYTGLALLKDGQPVAEESRKEFYEAVNFSGKTKCCKRFKQSTGS